MANATPSRLGQINAENDADALFLKVFPNEVLTTFVRNSIMFHGANGSACHEVRTIQSGKSAAFPAIGTITASYHVPGVEILGSAINHNERLIHIDGTLIADTFVAEIDELKNHYDVRAPYAEQLGAALAKEGDQRVLRTVVLAARASSTLTGGSGGSQLTNASYANTADTLVQGIFDAGQKLDEKDVPEMGRFCVVKPAQYNLLVQSSKALHRDWNASFENGSVGEGKIFQINGIIILKSNNLPSSNVAAVSGENNTYSGDFSNTAAVVFHKSAVGTVKLQDLKFETEYDIRRQGTLMLAKYVMGHGILRPESAVELKLV